MNLSNLFSSITNRHDQPAVRAAITVQPRTVQLPVPIHLPSVRSVLGALRCQVPGYSAMLGTCEDGLPFLLDLQDASAGSLLVTADAGSGKTRLLQAIVDSLVQLNSASEVQYALITPYPEEWQRLTAMHMQTGHCRGVFTGNDPAAHRLILEASSLAESRRDGAVGGPVVVLVIDDLSPLLEASYDVQVNLHWLISGGAQNGVWTMVAANAGQALNLHYWIDLFRTRLLGKIAFPAVGQRLGIRPGSAAHTLRAGVQFTAWVDGRWLTFWAADPECA